MKRYSAERFLEILIEIVFLNYLTYTCVNDAYSDFIFTLVGVINFISPAKKIRVKANSKPWFDYEFVSAIQRREKFKHSGLQTDKYNFKVAKMHLQKIILKKKKSYFEQELDKNRNKPKELWKALKSLGLSSDKAQKTNTFKRFYSELARALQEKLPMAPNTFTTQTTKNYYTRVSCNVSNDFELSNVSEEIIKKILLSLDTNKATGMGQIPAKFLSDGAEVLALPLRNIINLSIKLSTFLEECKVAKLKPIFKKGARTDPQNYRPISLLPLVSKIIEKSIQFHTEDYLNRRKLIYIYQSCLRKNHSTDFYLAQLTDFVLVSLDKQMHTGRSSESIRYFRSWSSPSEKKIF